MENNRFCEHCGSQIHEDSVICPKCGRQINELKTEEDNKNANIIINNSNQINGPVVGGKLCDKWVSFFLCLFLGFLGAHKFYEGKTGLGIIYLFTFGLFFIGCFIDLITILFKPNQYYA